MQILWADFWDSPNFTARTLEQLMLRIVNPGTITTLLPSHRKIATALSNEVLSQSHIAILPGSTSTLPELHCYISRLHCYIASATLLHCQSCTATLPDLHSYIAAATPLYCQSSTATSVWRILLTGSFLGENGRKTGTFSALKQAKNGRN